MKKLEFGDVQFRIMNVIWKHGRVSARDITDEMNRQVPIAHSTVQTLLRTLEDKGAIDHDIEDRTFIFYPLVENSNVVKHATERFINRIFNGSADRMISYMVKNQYISQEELKKISDMIDEDSSSPRT